MRKRTIFKLLIILGLLPLIMPFASGLYIMSIESWELFDWIIMYSFIYWPTYIIGAVFIVLSILGLKQNKI